MVEEHELAMLLSDEFFGEASFSIIDTSISQCRGVRSQVEEWHSVR
jgi:hypothetical protein